MRANAPDAGSRAGEGRARWAWAVLLLASAASAPSALAHPEGVFIHRNAAGRLGTNYDFTRLYPLPDEIPDLPGPASDNHDFEEVLGDTPEEDIFRLEPGTKIALEVIAFDAGLRLRDVDEPAIFVDAPGDLYALGTGRTGFARFVWWHLDPDAPARGEYRARFRFVDRTGVHEPSPVYTQRFEGVPAPGPAAGLLLASAAGLARRRRR